MSELWGRESDEMRKAMETQQKLNALESQVIDAMTWGGLRPEVFQISIWMPSSRIYHSPWWAMAIIATMLVAMSWCGTSPRARADDTLADYLANYDRSLATHRVDHYRAVLGFADPIEVSVERDSAMPKQADGREVDAHTTRAWRDEKGREAGCVVHVTRISVQRASILAHEVCHCVGDYAVLGPWGYVGVGKEERREREKAADSCTERLMR